MKRQTKQETARLALLIKSDWTCRYGLRNADKLSMAVRRLFRKPKIRRSADKISKQETGGK